jgi:hypothetical protein
VYVCIAPSRNPLAVLTLCAQVTAGTIGYYLSEYFRTFGQAEAIYTMVIAGLSCLVGLIGPFAGYVTWPGKQINAAP